MPFWWYSIFVVVVILFAAVAAGIADPGTASGGLFVMAVILLFVGPPVLAARKGYDWHYWILAWGLGLVILAFLPNESRPEDAQASYHSAIGRLRRSNLKTGNTIGVVLTILNAIGILGWILLFALL